MSITIRPAYDSLSEVKELFSEYTDMLMNNDPDFSDYLALQNYKQEMELLPAKYALPDGRLYLAYCDEKLAGCIALKRMDKQSCEMKRLYVRPAFRNRQIGRRLVQQIIDDAKAIGYSHILLDTIPFLQSAIHMYKQFGFYEIACYNDNPIAASVYMRLDISNAEELP